MNTKKGRRVLLAVVLALSLIAAACGGDDSPSGEVDGTLTIGYVLPSTGGLSVIIDALVRPIEMAVSEIDAVGDTEVVLSQVFPVRSQMRPPWKRNASTSKSLWGPPFLRIVN